jgi:hypothetical protein
MEKNITYKHLYSSDQKLKWWGYGEWIEEPDEAEFEHNGILCKIIRADTPKDPNQEDVFGGHLCGYCRIPKNHIDYKCKKPFDLPYSVHGGITYGRLEEDEEYWIGFDCAHSGDIVPSLEIFKKKYGEYGGIKELKSQFPDAPCFKEHYRNIQFVVEECKSLAEQIAEKILPPSK